jgi:hypothetical protein
VGPPPRRRIWYALAWPRGVAPPDSHVREPPGAGLYLIVIFQVTWPSHKFGWRIAMRLPGRWKSPAGLVISAAFLVALVANHDRFFPTGPTGSRLEGRLRGRDALRRRTGRGTRRGKTVQEAWRAGGKFGPDSPGEFARLLAEMKFPVTGRCRSTGRVTSTRNWRRPWTAPDFAGAGTCSMPAA